MHVVIVLGRTSIEQASLIILQSKILSSGIPARLHNLTRFVAGSGAGVGSRFKALILKE